MLINAITCIVRNSFIVYHNVVYRQCIGIPMGTNSAPFMANIYLHTFEYNYIEKLIKDGKVDIAKRLSDYTYRYQDDCVIFNDNDIFRNSYEDMYAGSAMELKNTNISRDKCNFLDLTISLHRGKFIYRSYDKRKDFDFNVVNYPNLIGNIPSSQSYGVFISQLARFCNVNGNLRHFISDTQNLVNTLINQHFQAETLFSRYRRFCFKYVHLWAKYNQDINSTLYITKIFGNTLKRVHN